ncbi:MAG: NAD(P)H-dependent glycerol-3-phosphate dehydrogenase [Pseudomonadota bacterium]
MAAQRITVLGAGSWGTALALQAVRAGHRVTLWGRDESLIDALGRSRENHRYLPGVTLPDALTPEADIQRALAGADGVIVATPSSTFSSMLDAVAAHSDRPALIWACKGFELKTGRLLHAVAAEKFGDRYPMAIATGPSFAREVAIGLPTAITVAANDLRTADALADWLRSDAFRAYTSDDIVGAQVGGALKNVLAIAAGISDGLRYGANARAALITRGLAELTRIGVALGGRPDTLAGLTGLGDLLLTATDDQSRNRRFGLAIADGGGVAAAQASVGQTVEGYLAAEAAWQLAQQLGVEAPIIEQVYAVLYNAKQPDHAVRSLLSRGSRAESDRRDLT